MPAFDAPRDREDIIIIRDEKHWDPHESARARTVVRVADEEWVKNQQIFIRPKKGNRAQRRAQGGLQRQDADVDIKNQLGAVNRLWVQRMLVDWTFTKDGMPMPISSESMKLLDQSYVDYIYEAIMDAQPKDPDDDDTEQGEDEDDDSDEDPTLDAASLSIVGEMSNLDEEQPEEPSVRNYLKKF